jgi:transposase
MEHFAGLDVSVKETSVCIVDETGKIVREVKVASEPDALLAVLKSPAYRFKRIGLEAGPLSQWLYSALAEAGLPVICVETRHMRAVLKAQINKTDRNDARGMAQMMRVGLYRPVHVKTLRSQKLRMLLTHRKLLQSKAIAIDNDLRGTLRNFGLKVGMVGTVKFEARIRKLVENLPDLAALVEPLLIVRRTLREQFCILLYEAAQAMMRSKKWSWLKAWAMQIARRRGMKKAIVALARRLAVVMHRIWVDGTAFRWTREQIAAAA